MPEIDGPEKARRLRKRRPGNEGDPSSNGLANRKRRRGREAGPPLRLADQGRATRLSSRKRSWQPSYQPQLNVEL